VSTSYGDPIIWGVILVVGVATFAIRFSFIALFGRLNEMPPRLARPLRYVPPAVLAALVLPAFLVPESGADLEPAKIAAGTIAAGVAWRTENVFATMVAGMGTLWLVRFLLLPAVQ